ncbi:MAG: Ig-like domain-containing protein [Deltaproteobacteria bacterium]|nr:Ig-like domain-containing protein [Deltaproteobacteria bacterium]MDE0035851.1 Ig-like domain-containing protein [Deltaproteobacteria bacterium]
METVIERTETASVCFEDPNMDMLTLTAQSANPGVATASLVGDQLSVTGVDEGSTTVTVTATDPGGLTGTSVFPVTVKRAIDVVVASCEGERQGSRFSVEIRGRATANTAVEDLVFVGYVDNSIVGRDFLGRMSKNETESIRITGTIGSIGSGVCRLRWAWNWGDAGGDIATHRSLDLGSTVITIRDR